MADIELVIKIPEEVKRALGNNEEYRLYTESICHVMLTAIKDGTPLPKGHGRLIDADDIDNHIIGHVDTRNCPTIIEADTESEGV